MFFVTNITIQMNLTFILFNYFLNTKSLKTDNQYNDEDPKIIYKILLSFQKRTNQNRLILYICLSTNLKIKIYQKRKYTSNTSPYFSFYFL